ncbi:hypothetical protein BHE74_00052530 [Ensete ventricosum]|nr:hypothetical protein BHE74_00052530 [Ensete ventricosum]
MNQTGSSRLVYAVNPFDHESLACICDSIDSSCSWAEASGVEDDATIMDSSSSTDLKDSNPPTAPARRDGPTVGRRLPSTDAAST